MNRFNENKTATQIKSDLILSKYVYLLNIKIIMSLDF